MDIGEDRKETGYDDVSAYDIIKDIKEAITWRLPIQNYGSCFWTKR